MRSPLTVRAYGVILLISFVVICYDSKEKVDRLLKQFNRFVMFFLLYSEELLEFLPVDQTCKFCETSGVYGQFWQKQILTIISREFGVNIHDDGDSKYSYHFLFKL